MIRLRRFASLFALLLVAPAALANAELDRAKAAIAAFRQTLPAADLAVLDGVAAQALKSDLYKPLPWANPATGTAGTVTPHRPEDSDPENPCRVLDQRAVLNGRELAGESRWCKTGYGGDWFKVY
ncbi:MAG TPA: RT0821/Lpp0805 family surface protein [Alphaproteobacteria bacterium]|nr:RT0821/Lpp0805 family surface protein [Alphaproteobacteria bacterium]